MHSIPLLRLLKERGDVDRVEVVEKLFVDGGHLNSDFAGRLLLTEGESKFRSNNVPKVRGHLPHRIERKTGVWEDKTHPAICGAEIEDFLMKSMKVDPFVANIQCGLIYLELLSCAEVSVRSLETRPIERRNRGPSEALDGGGWSEDGILIRLLGRR